jgi:hypothetical protein
MKPVAQEILNAIDKAIPFVGRSSGGDMGSATVVVELGPETLRVLSEVQADLKRIADHFDPQPADIVGTPYLEDKRGNPQGLPRSRQRQWTAVEVLPSPD